MDLPWEIDALPGPLYTQGQAEFIIRRAIKLGAKKMLVFADENKTKEDRKAARLRAEEAEELLVEMVMCLRLQSYDLEDAVKEIERLAAIEFDLCAAVADKTAEIAKLKSAIVLQHAEREAQGMLLRSLIARLSNDQIAQVFGDQVGHMADLLHAQREPKP